VTDFGEEAVVSDPLSMLCFVALGVICAAVIADAQPLPGTGPLKMEGDLAAQMVAGMDRFLMRETGASAGRRADHWQRDFSSPEAYVRSVEPNRARFQKIIGAVDAREPAEMARVEKILPLTPSTHPVAPMRSRPLPSLPQGERGRKGYTVHAVRWSVLKGVEGEGLLLLPEGEAVADVVALGDCDWTPEMLAGLAPGVPEGAQFARRLTEQGALPEKWRINRDRVSGACGSIGLFPA
jgi:hypothetical protein